MPRCPWLASKKLYIERLTIEVEDQHFHIGVLQCVRDALGESVIIQSFYPNDRWKSEPFGFETRDGQCGRSTNNVDILVFIVYLRTYLSTAHFNVLSKLLTRRTLDRNQNRFCTFWSRTPSGACSFLSGTTNFLLDASPRYWEKGVPAPQKGTTDSLSAWDELRSSSRINNFSDIGRWKQDVAIKCWLYKFCFWNPKLF